MTINKQTFDWVPEAVLHLGKLHALWLSKKDTVAILVSNFVKTNIGEYLDHESVFDDNVKGLEHNKMLVVQDCDLLRQHLGELKSAAVGAGKYKIANTEVTRTTLGEYRQAVIAELDYKTQLLRYINTAIERKRQNKVARSAWKDRNTSREERIATLNNIFVGVAKEMLSRDVFHLILDEAHRRKDLLEG